MENKLFIFLVSEPKLGPFSKPKQKQKQKQKQKKLFSTKIRGETHTMLGHWVCLPSLLLIGSMFYEK